jgi:hypothetical protein
MLHFWISGSSVEEILQKSSFEPPDDTITFQARQFKDERSEIPIDSSESPMRVRITSLKKHYNGEFYSLHGFVCILPQEEKKPGGEFEETGIECIIVYNRSKNTGVLHMLGQVVLGITKDEIII